MAKKNESFLHSLAKKYFGKADPKEVTEEVKKIADDISKEGKDLEEKFETIPIEQMPGEEFQPSEDVMKELNAMMYGKSVNNVPLTPNRKEEEKVIVDLNQELRPPVDGTVEVEISSDEMEAFITVTKAKYGGREIEPNDIYAALAEEKVVFGIIPPTIDSIAKNDLYDKRVKVAAGISKVNGKNGYIEEVVKVSDATRGPKERTDGTLDFKELGRIINVEKGQLICRVYPPVAGRDGKTVRGNDIKYVPGRGVQSPVGRNVVLNEDGTMLIAAISGSVSVAGGKYSVSEIYKVSGNVDISTGNINFLGSVIVDGDVKEGFSVIATDEIKISGMVEGAYIKAGASIKINKGINGMGKGIIIANGDVHSKFIENCRIQAYGDVVAETIISSNIKCDNEIIVTSGKGVIMGGNYVVGNGVNARIIGSASNITTEFTLGVSVVLDEQIANLKKEAETVKTDIIKLNQVATYFSELAKRNQLDSQKMALYNSAVYTHNEKIKVLEDIKSQIAQLEEQLNESSKCTLSAKDTIYPGTVVTIGRFNTKIKSELVKPLLYLGDNGIVIAEGAGK